MLARLETRQQRRALMDVLTTLSSNIGMGILSSISGIMVARLLSQTARGELAAAASWALMLQALLQWGVGLTLVYTVKREPESTGSVLSAALILLLIQSAFVIVIGVIGTVLILPNLNPQIVTSTQIYLATIPFTLLIMYIGSIGQGLGRFRLFNSVRLLPSVAYLLILISAWIWKINEVSYLVTLLFCAYVVIGVGALWWFVRNIQPLQQCTRHQVWQLLIFGLKTYIGAISWSVNNRLDQFLMSLFIPLGQLGIYAVAYAYSSLLLGISSAFSAVMYSKLQLEEGAADVITRTLKMVILTNGGFCVVLAIVCPLFLPFLFGETFRAAVPYAQLLLVGSVFLGINSVLADGLHALGFPLQRSEAELIGVCITITGLLLVLPSRGALGAALVSLLSYCIVSIVLLYFYYKKIQL